jgi:hypothetical protein
MVPCDPQHSYQICRINANGCPMFYYTCSCGARGASPCAEPMDAVDDALWHLAHPDRASRD